MAGSALLGEDYSGPIAHIDLDALGRNYAFFQDQARGAETAAVVKCDAYGLGLDPIAATLAEAGCNTFFVAYPEEGAALRGLLADINRQPVIYIFHGAQPETLPLFDEFNLVPVLNSLDEAQFWAGARPGAPAAISVETGMNRFGVEPEKIAAAAALKTLNVEMVMSHLACASTPDHPLNARQRDAFGEAVKAFPHARQSLAASAGVLLGPDYHFDLVRPGIALYGGGPMDNDDPRIENVVTLRAPIRQVRIVRPGESVGYGATYSPETERRIAIVSLGYGDGFLRAGSNAAHALVSGDRAPIAGRISMDLIALDITECDAKVSAGDRAVFFGPELRLHEAAAGCNTIAYELLTGLGGRVDRRYVGKTLSAGASEGG